MAVRSVEGASKAFKKPEAEVRHTEKDSPPLSLDELRAELRSVGEQRYHHKHPFHLMMHEGRLSRGQL